MRFFVVSLLFLYVQLSVGQEVEEISPKLFKNEQLHSALTVIASIKASRFTDAMNLFEDPDQILLKRHCRRIYRQMKSFDDETMELYFNIVIDDFSVYRFSYFNAKVEVLQVDIFMSKKDASPMLSHMTFLNAKALKRKKVLDFVEEKEQVRFPAIPL